MKKLIYIIFIAVTLSSCYKLKTEIFDTINPTVFPKNEADAWSLTASVYDVFSPYVLFSMGDGYIVGPELVTDDSHCRWGGQWVFYKNLDFRPEQGWITRFYSNNLPNLSKMTLNIDRINSINMNQEKKDRYIAEIRCGRGYLYYFLFDLYGTIPIIPLDVLKNPLGDQIVPRPTNAEMVKFIEDDLLAARDKLPYKYAKSEYGRFTKGLANMVLLKLYMHEKNWAKAEEIGRELMKPEYGYELMPTYKSIFTLENEGNNEIIYASTANSSKGTTWLTFVLPDGYPLKYPGRLMWGGPKIDWEFFDTFEPTDDRLKSIISEYTSDNGVHYDRNTSGGPLQSGAVPLKYAEDPVIATADMQIDWVVFRYADELLLLSEAIANKTGNVTQECLDLLNRVRTRANLPVLTSKDCPDLKTFNSKILLERGHELWYEGCRRSDLIRHGKYVEFMKKKWNGTLLVKDNYVLWPLPQTAINEGKGIILQNPGY